MSLRVLHLIPGLCGTGGAEQSIASSAPGLMEAGIDLHLATWTDRRDLEPDLERAGAVCHSLGPAKGTFRLVPRVRRLIREVQPDVVHASLFDASVPAQLACTVTRTPLLVTWASTSYAPGRRAEPGTNWRKVQAVRTSEIALDRISRCHYQAVTAGVATSMRAALHVPASRVHVVERGRDGASIRSAAPTDLVPLGVPKGSSVVLAVGRLEPPKGYPMLIRAVARIMAGHDDIHLVIAGRDGADSPAIRAEIERAGIGRRVHLLGHRTDIPGLLAAADVFVLSSLREGAAGAVIEAMAAGTPVVACRTDGLVGVLEDGVNARVVDRDRLGDALVEVLNDDDVARTLIEGGTTCFDERFDTRAEVSNLSRLYRTLASA